MDMNNSTSEIELFSPGLFYVPHRPVRIPQKTKQLVAHIWHDERPVHCLQHRSHSLKEVIPMLSEKNDSVGNGTVYEHCELFPFNDALQRQLFPLPHSMIPSQGQGLC